MNPLLRNSLLVAALLVPGIALGQQFQSSGSIDNVVNQFTSSANAWYGTLLGLAQGLFGLLATIQLAWAAIKWVLEGDDVKALMASLVKQIITIGFFFWVLTTADTWVPAILDSFTQAGQAAGGSTALTPSAIIDEGLYIAALIPERIGEADFFMIPLIAIVAGLAALVVLGGFVIAACQLAVTQVISSVVLAGGVLLLGFGGSSFTRDFVQKYFSYAISTGVRLLVLYLVLGIAVQQAGTWRDIVTNGEGLMPFFEVMAASIFFAFLCWTVPKTAGEMLGGAIDMSAGAVAGGVAAGAVGGAAAAAGLAATAAPLRGALQAATAGVQAESAAGASGAKAVLGGIGRAASAAGTEAKASAASYVGLGNKSEYARTSETIGGRAASRIESESRKETADRAAGSATPGGAQAGQPSTGGNAGSAGSNPTAAGGDAARGISIKLDEAASVANSGPSSSSGSRQGVVQPGDRAMDTGKAAGLPASNLAEGGGAAVAPPANATPAEAATSVASRGGDTPQASTAAASVGTSAPASTVGGLEAAAPSVDTSRNTKDRDFTNPLQRPDLPPDAGPPAGITIRLDDPE